MRYRPSKVRTWFILLTGNLVWTFAAWAGGPVVPSDPSRYLRIQRFTTTEIPGCAEAASLSNSHPSLGIVASIASTQHISSGLLRQELVRTVPPQTEISLGCSWWRGAMKPTDLRIIGAFIPIRPVRGDHPKAGEHRAKEVAPASLSWASCRSPLLYEMIEIGQLLEQDAWFAGRHVAVQGIVSSGAKECVPQDCPADTKCPRWRASLRLGAFEGEQIELAADQRHPAGCEKDPREKSWSCFPVEAGRTMLAWGVWSPSGRPGVLVMEGYCQQ